MPEPEVPQLPDIDMLSDIDIEHRDHFLILVNAFAIYLDRDKVRGDLWRTRPPTHKLMMIEEKSDRIKAGLSRLKHLQLNAAKDDVEAVGELLNVIFDDALDIINFAVFLIREVKAGDFA